MTFSWLVAKPIPGITPLEPRSNPHSTSSLTALAFAPGVLNTTTPFWVHSPTGTLFTPAPALATALSGFVIDAASNLKLLNKIASAPVRSGPTSKLSLGNFSKPSSEIALKVCILCIFSSCS